jgi:hypothetical protein
MKLSLKQQGFLENISKKKALMDLLKKGLHGFWRNGFKIIDGNQP